MLNLTEGRISQILQATVIRLRRSLSDAFYLLEGSPGDPKRVMEVFRSFERNASLETAPRVSGRSSSPLLPDRQDLLVRGVTSRHF